MKILDPQKTIEENVTTAIGFASTLMAGNNVFDTEKAELVSNELMEIIKSELDELEDIAKQGYEEAYEIICELKQNLSKYKEKSAILEEEFMGFIDPNSLMKEADDVISLLQNENLSLIKEHDNLNDRLSALFDTNQMLTTYNVRLENGNHELQKENHDLKLKLSHNSVSVDKNLFTGEIETFRHDSYYNCNKKIIYKVVNGLIVEKIA